MTFHQVTQYYYVQIVLEDTDPVFRLDSLYLGKGALQEVGPEPVFQKCALLRARASITVRVDASVFKGLPKTEREYFRGYGTPS
jgi:hypothetical protein